MGRNYYSRPERFPDYIVVAALFVVSVIVFSVSIVLAI